MTVQELYDFAKSFGLENEQLDIYVMHDADSIEFIAEQPDRITFDEPSITNDGSVQIFIRRDQSNCVWSSESYAEHAEWQTCINEEDSGFVHCSKCHAEFRIADLERVGDDKGFVNYCPACGTRMIDHGMFSPKKLAILRE